MATRGSGLDSTDNMVLGVPDAFVLGVSMELQLSKKSPSDRIKTYFIFKGESKERELMDSCASERS
ncbi:hypothetical protein GCM10023172_00660 [Hymenobacter ginsengisoli]|uniref:Uncharacterized protein n=1 Tax=Hymenobacter ginsengisoli TaxID=1051626 RepID=A0ABP8PTD4_9BACT